MTTINLLLAASNIGTGLLIILLCRPLLKDKIKRNYLYGIRFPKSLESDENWYAINRFGAAEMTRWSWLLIPAGILSLFLPLAGNRVLTLFFALLPALVVIPPCIATWKYAQNL